MNRSQQGATMIPKAVTDYFRAGGKITRTYYCPKHGAVRSIVPASVGHSCPSCSLAEASAR